MEDNNELDELLKRAEEDNDDNSFENNAEKEDNTEDFSKTSQKLIDVNNDDYDDFEELKKDIKSNSILIKIVSILFVLILLLGCLILANNYFDLGLF